MDEEKRREFFAQLDQEISELNDPQTGMISDRYSHEIACPLCSTLKDEELLFIKNGFNFVRCLNCSMIYTNPQVKEEYLNQIYGRSKAEDLWTELQESEQERKWKDVYYLDCLSILDKHIDKTSCDLLDVGCSTGGFIGLVRTKKEEWNAHGIEVGKKAFKIARDKGLEVENKRIEQLGLDKKYDLITAFGVLEHIPNPRAFLETTKRFAKNGNLYVMIIVPNAYSLYHMFLREKSTSFDGRDHLVFFSMDTLSQLFRQCGYQVVFSDTVLTGIDALQKYIQWWDPYSAGNSTEHIPENIINIIKLGSLERYMMQNDLGLRIRMLGKLEGN